jgi:hypothetical protein
MWSERPTALAKRRRGQQELGRPHKQNNNNDFSFTVAFALGRQQVGRSQAGWLYRALSAIIEPHPRGLGRHSAQLGGARVGRWGQWTLKCASYPMATLALPHSDIYVQS